MIIELLSGADVIPCNQKGCTGYMAFQGGNLEEMSCTECGIIHQDPIIAGGRLL